MVRGLPVPVFCAACLVCLLARAQTAAPTPASATTTVTSLPHAQTSVRWGRAEGLVDAPLTDVLRVIEDYGQYYTFLPHFQTSRVLSQRGSTAIVYLEATVAMDTLKLWAQVKLAPAPNVGTTRVIEARMMKGNMDILQARWELTPVDALHTTVAFQLLLEPRVPLPASLLTSENEKASRKTIAALRKKLAARPAGITDP